MKRIPFKSGDEQDALEKARRYYHWRAGQRARIKRRYRRRVRAEVREIVERSLVEHADIWQELAKH